MSTDKPTFTALAASEIEAVMKEGSERKWIEGVGQTVLWANCAVELDTKKGDKWEKFDNTLGRSMRGTLPQNWALLISEGKVIEK